MQISTNYIRNSYIQNLFEGSDSFLHDVIYNFELDEPIMEPWSGTYISSFGRVGANENKLFIEYCQDNDLIFEVSKSENIHLKAILNTSLTNLNNYLQELKPGHFKIKVYLWKDIEIENWEQIIIEVKTNYSDFEEMDRLWDNLITIVSNSYEDFIKRVDMKETKFEVDALYKICPVIESLND